MAQNDIIINVKTSGAEQSAKSISAVNSSIKNIGDVAGGVLVAGALQGLAGQMVNLATGGFGLVKSMENAKIGFTTLLGSAEEADAVLTRIKKEAAATPFDMAGLVENTQALTTITKDGNKAVDVLLNVGKAISASGKGMTEMNRVVLNLQQIASTGKVTEMDIRQMQGAIPLFNDIIAGAGLTTESLKEAENAGELLFEAFRKASAEGVTKNAFTDAAGSFDQLYSTMMDTLSIVSGDIIEKTGIYESLKKIMRITTELATEGGENIDKLINKFEKTGNVITKIVDFLSRNQETIAYLIIGTIDNVLGLISFFSEQINILTEQVGSAAKFISQMGEGFSKLFNDPVEALGIFGNAFKDFFITHLQSSIDLVNNLIGLINQLTGSSIPQVGKTQQDLSKLQTGNGTVVAPQGTPIHTITAPAPKVAPKKVANQQLFLSGAPKFAGGGIVGGSSYSGDRVVAQVNSGEMILNKEQQSTLFNMLKNGAGGIIIHNMTVMANDVNDFRKSLSAINSSTFNGFNLGVA